MTQKKAVIIGAGPAGLTAAYELLTRTNIMPIIIEKTDYVGGLSATFDYKGNKIDIGGHRFFSKSDRVMHWWLTMLPLQQIDKKNVAITYHGKSQTVAATEGPNPQREDRVMLLRKRKSRIFFNRKFFDYPLTLSGTTLKNMGLQRTILAGTSYLKSVVFPIKKEKNLEHFFINRFGNNLYQTFFKSYTEKVWGVPCASISAEWGAQRIKTLSIAKTIKHYITAALSTNKDIAQKNTETSLIEYFLYPKFGPGHLWQEVANKIQQLGGTILYTTNVTQLRKIDTNITQVLTHNTSNDTLQTIEADYVFSSMPVKSLVQIITPNAPTKVQEIAQGLLYRNFITVGVLVKKLALQEQQIVDNWIYIQEPDVQVGRIQIFNNWSPYMVADQSTTWLGLEYFCNESDDLWHKSEAVIIELAKQELLSLGFARIEDVIDATVIKINDVYPAYFGSYNQFGIIRSYLDTIENLFLIGRNGMHKYNNQDHSMLTAMTAVDNIIAGTQSKENIWAVNTEQNYHETR